jgi:hypothetical protein
LNRRRPLDAYTLLTRRPLSLKVWLDWLDLCHAVVYATPEPEGELPRPAVLGGCEVLDRARHRLHLPHSSSPNYGMVRFTQRAFVPRLVA